MTSPQLPARQFSQVWSRMTMPSPAIREPDQRRQARLLASVLVLLVPVTLFINIAARLALSTAFDNLGQSPGFRIVLVATLLFTAAYGLSRSTYYFLAAVFTIVTMSVTIFVLAASNFRENSTLFAFLVVPLLLASIFLRLQTIAWIIALHLIGILLFPAFIPAVTLAQMFAVPFSYTALVSLLVLMVTYNRNLLEADRKTDLEETVALRTQELTRTNREFQAEITARQWAQEELSQSEARNQAILNAMPDLMLRVSRDGTIRDFKPPANNSPIAFLLPDELVGKKATDVFPAEVSQQFVAGVERAIASGDILILEYQFPLKGSLIDGEIRIVASGPDEALFIVRDITQRKQMEEELRRALEQEKHLSEIKLRFFSMVSHEFRTPLSTILSSNSLLEQFGHKMTDERKQGHHHNIETQVRHLTELLDEVMLINKSEGGMLEFNPLPIELEAECRQIVEEIQVTADTHQIVFTATGSAPEAVMDKKLLRHILINLLTNAVKYSPQGGTVSFDLTCNGGEATFRIKDEGIGIPDEDQAHLFEVFHRARNAEAIDGTGLGLAITRRAVDQHQGTISFESRVGSGTTFTVCLPLAPAVPALNGDSGATAR